MNKKNIGYFIVILATVVGLAMLLNSNKKSASSGAVLSSEKTTSSALVIAPSSFDFGTISMAKGKVAHTFTIKNTGTVPVIIKKIFTSCMCTTATLVTAKGKVGPFGMAGHMDIPKINKTVALGEEVFIEATFDPAAHGPAGTGKVHRVVYIETEGSNKALELSFEATVTQ